MSSPGIIRTPQYIKVGNRTLFAWVYYPGENIRDFSSVVILCPLLGQEFMSVHRSYRALADTLCESGHVVIRFDFHNSGDSSGENVEQLTLNSCIDDLVGIVDFARKAFSPGQISCIGFSFGALVSHLATQRTRVDNLILWEPVLSGKRYLRQLRMLGMSGREQAGEEAIVEAAGVFLTPEFCSQLENLDFSNASSAKADCCLILNSNISPALEKLSSSWCNQGVSTSIEEYHGYAEMIAYPIDTVVPESALEKINTWLGERQQESSGSVRDTTGLVQIDKLTTDSLSVSEFVEYPGIICEKQLFGILTVPKHINNKNRCVVFLNCGSEHHVGPHRMYTEFCRSLAREGIVTFRFDIEGIGDSPSQGNNQDNFSYSPCVLDDVRSALEFLRAKLVNPEFVLVGICAGAYHSFKSAANLENFNITYACLVNPLVFYWENNMAERELKRIGLGRERAKYKELIFRLQTWKNVLTRPVAVLNMFKVYFNHFLLQIGSLFHGRSASQTEVRQSILNIEKARTRLVLFISENDPGLNLYLDEGGKLARKTFKNGLASVIRLPNSDHGLSKLHMRQCLYNYFLKVIKDSG